MSDSSLQAAPFSPPGRDGAPPSRVLLVSAGPQRGRAHRRGGSGGRRPDPAARPLAGRRRRLRRRDPGAAARAGARDRVHAGPRRPVRAHLGGRATAWRPPRWSGPSTWALGTVEWRSFSHIGKLDGDTLLPPDYLEEMLERFEADPGLGVAGGALTERSEGELEGRSHPGRPRDRPGPHLPSRVLRGDRRHSRAARLRPDHRHLRPHARLRRPHLRRSAGAPPAPDGDQAGGAARPGPPRGHPLHRRLRVPLGGAAGR